MVNSFNVVTGASRGIGEHIARYLFQYDDSHLLSLARSADELNTYKREYEASVSDKNRFVFPVSVDLTQPASIHSIEIPKECKVLKTLVLNAGTFFPAGILDSGDKEIRAQFELNFFAMIEVVQKMAPYFKDGVTNIFVTASSASYEGIGTAGMYAASKHAVLGFARSLRQELSARKIRVTAIAPGSTWSSSWEGSGVDPNTLIDPLDIAKTIHFVMNTSIRSNFDEIIINPV